MSFVKRWKYLPAGIAVIMVIFIASSLLDVLLYALHPRFYSTAAFIVIFGVGGIFAGALCYAAAISVSPVKTEMARWSIIIMIIATGILFFFVLSALEDGEYAMAFKSFGVSLALTSLLFTKGKVEL